MSKQTAISARGVLVDFDMLKIKQQMATSPKTVDVKARENFVDQRLRRRVNRLAKQQTEQVVAQVEVQDIPTPNEVEKVSKTEDNTNTKVTSSKKGTNNATKGTEE